LFVVALAGTLAVNVPIDRQINEWTLATLPADWMQVRDRWELWHTIRTVASLASLACIMASALRVSDAALAHSAESSESRESGTQSGYGRAAARQV